MPDSLQKAAFLQYEADKWFSRNFEVLEKYNSKDDKIISLLKTYNLNPKNLLEIGSSAGYRLNGIKSEFPKVNVVGVEPSGEAVNFGRSKYPEVKFQNGTADNMSFFKDASFDVVIVGFVFYVVDRNLLLRTISEIDRVLNDNGFLIIIDFFTENSVKRNYAHISEFSAFSYKEKYDEMFTSTHLYHLISRSCYNHDTMALDATSEYQNLYSISLLKKDLHASYK